MCNMQKMPSREDASCEEDSDMNFATFSAVGAPGTHFVTTGGQLPVTKIQQNVSNNGTGMQQVCVAMGDGGVQYMRALDASASLQAAPQLISVPIALPGAKPGDPQPTVQIQVLNPNLLQAQQQPKYQMQIPIQGFQQGGAVLTLAYSPENEAGGIQLVGQGSLGEGLQVLATLPHEMQLVQPTQEKDHMQNMHQVFITPNQQIIINGPENKTLNNNTSSDNNNDAMDIIIKEECDETTNDDESSQGTEASDSVQWQLGTSHQQDLVKYLSTLPPQQTQALPASLQQFLRKNPTDVKSEPVEIDIDMDDVVADDKKEEPVAEAVLSEGLYLESSSEQQRSELDLQDYVQILNEESNDTFESLKDNFPKMKSPAYKTNYLVKKNTPMASHFGMQSKKLSKAKPSYKTIDQSIAKIGTVTNQLSKQLTEVFPVPKRPRNIKRKNLKSASQPSPVTKPVETIDLETEDYPDTSSKPKAVSRQRVIPVKNIKNKADEPAMNTNQHSVEPDIQFLPVFKKPPLKVLPVLINAPVKTLSHESQMSTPLQYIAYKSVKQLLAQVRPMMKESCNPTENTRVKNKTVESPKASPPVLKKARTQTKDNKVDYASNETAKLRKEDPLKLSDKTIKPAKVSPLTYESNNPTVSSPKAFLPVTSKLHESSKYNLISYPSNHIIEPPKVSSLASKSRKQTRNKSVKYLPYKTIGKISESLTKAKDSFEQFEFNVKTPTSYQINEPLSENPPLVTNITKTTKDNSETFKSTNLIKHSSKAQTVTNKSYKQAELNQNNYKSFQIIEPVQEDFSSVPTNSFSTEISTATYPSYQTTQSQPDTSSAANDLFQKANVNPDEYSLETIEPLPLSETFSEANDIFDQTSSNIKSLTEYQSIQPQSNSFPVTNKALESLPKTVSVTNDSIVQNEIINETYSSYQTSKPLPEFVSGTDQPYEPSNNDPATYQSYENVEQEGQIISNDTYGSTEIEPQAFPSRESIEPHAEMLPATDESSVDPSAYNSDNYQTFQIIEPSPDDAVATETYEFTEIPPDMYESYETLRDESEVANDIYNSSNNNTVINDQSNYELHETEAPPKLNKPIDAIDAPPVSYQSYTNNEQTEGLSATNSSYDSTDGPMAYQSYQNLESLPESNPSSNVADATYPSFQIIEPVTEIEETLVEDQQVNYTTYGSCEQQTEALSGNSPYKTVDSFTNNERSYEMAESVGTVQPATCNRHDTVRSIAKAQYITNKFYQTTKQMADPANYQTYETVDLTEQQPITYQQYEVDQQLTGLRATKNQPYESGEKLPEVHSVTNQQHGTVQLIEQPLSTNQLYETVEQLKEQYDAVENTSNRESGPNPMYDACPNQTYDAGSNQTYETGPQVIAQPLATNQLYDTVEELKEQYGTVENPSELEMGPNETYDAGPNETYDAGTNETYEQGSQLIAQPLATNQLYDTVEKLKEQYGTVENPSELEMGPNETYDAGPNEKYDAGTNETFEQGSQLIAQPLATNQLYDTVEQLKEQYETVENPSELEMDPNQTYDAGCNETYNAGPNETYETGPQLIAQPLTTNQLYDTVEELKERYETVENPSDLEVGPNETYETGPQLIAQPLATNQLYDTVEELKERYETVENPSDLEVGHNETYDAGPNETYETGPQLIAQPLATNQLYDTVEELKERYETVENPSELEMGPNKTYDAGPNETYEAGPNETYDASPNETYETGTQLIAQPLATNQLYDTVEELKEQYETVENPSELEMGPNETHETGPQFIAQPLATNQLYDTVEELKERYETVENPSELKMGPNKTYDAGPNETYETGPQLIAQPLATNQLYDTVEELKERYETVENPSELEMGPNQTYDVGSNEIYQQDPQLIAQPLATNQLYDTVEELKERYETVENPSKLEMGPNQTYDAGPNETYETGPQLIAQPLATNQLYDTVGQLKEQYETVENPSELEMGPNQTYVAGPNETYETGPQLIAQPLATNQLFDTVEELKERYETVENPSELEMGPNQTYDAGPNETYETGPQLMAQPLATNQLYDTVGQLKEQYETVENPSELEMGPNQTYEAGPNETYDAGPNETYETGPNETYETGPQFIAQPLATNQLYDTVEELKERYETVENPSELEMGANQTYDAGPNETYEQGSQLVAQPLATNQLYDTVEELEGQYETVENPSELEMGSNKTYDAGPNETYDAGPNETYEQGPQLIAQPLATNQLYDTVEELKERYETVENPTELEMGPNETYETGPNETYETSPQLIAQPLATNQLYDTVEELKERYETVENPSELEMGPNQTYDAGSNETYQQGPQLIAQPLATNQLYDTVEELKERYETVENPSELEMGPNETHETGPQLIAQPLATNQLYDTVEELKERYETVENPSELEMGPNQTYEASPQLIEQPLITNQLYDTVEHLSENYQQYENLQHLTEQPLFTNYVYESGHQLTELQPAANQQYEAMLQQITEQLATNRQYETLQGLTDFQADINQFYVKEEPQSEVDPASYQPYEMIEPNVQLQTEFKTEDFNLNSPTLPLADLIPFTYPLYESLEPLKPLTDVSPSTYTPQDVVEPLIETPETSSYQSFGPLTEVFTVHYPQYENIEPISELYPSYETTGSFKHDLSMVYGSYNPYLYLKDEPYEILYLKDEPYDNLDAIEPCPHCAKPAHDPSDGTVEYFTEIPPPSNYPSHGFLEPDNELPSLTNSSFETAAPWNNFLPSENMEPNSLNDNNYPLYENNGLGGECFPNTAYRAKDPGSNIPYGTVELTKVPNVINTSSDRIEPVEQHTEYPFATNTEYNTSSMLSEVSPLYQALDTQTKVLPVPSSAYTAVKSPNTNILVSNPDQEPTKVNIVPHKHNKINKEIILDVNHKTQNKNKDNGISKGKIKSETKSSKGKASKSKSEPKPHVYKPRKKRATKKSNTESVKPNIECETKNTKSKVVKEPYYDIIKAKPISPSINIYNKDNKSKSEYDLERLKSVSEIIKTEAENAAKKKADIIVLRSELGTFTEMSEEDRLLNDPKRPRIGEKFTRLKKSIQRVTGLSYRNSRGVIIPDKSLKIGTCTCPLNCGLKIDETQQQKVFNEFHTLTTFKKQEEYLFALLKVFRKNNTYTTNTSSKRKHTLRYHITGSNGDQVIVCKTFFKKTLVISDGRISRALKRRPLNSDDLSFKFDDDDTGGELN